MTSTVKNFLLAGIGGAVAYGVIVAVMDALITGTDAASVFFASVVPIVVAAGVVWLVISVAFSG